MAKAKKKAKRTGPGRGGARPGAGRPRAVEGGRQLVVLLGEEHWAELERLRAEGAASYGDAVRRAIERSADWQAS